MEKILKNWVSFVEVTLMINAHRFAETKKSIEISMLYQRNLGKQQSIL